VTSGPTLFNTSYDNLDEHLKFKAFANEAVPVYFFNKGADCHLLMVHRHSGGEENSCHRFFIDH